MQADEQIEEKMEVDSEPAFKRKGRGFQSGENASEVQSGKPVAYDQIADTVESARGNAARSVEGWIVLVVNVHEEASEEDLQDLFGEFGDIKNLHLNLDRRTGYVKGYALVEYETRQEAEAAIDGASGKPLLEQVLQCDFAFVRPPTVAKGDAKPAGRKARGRSASPGRKLVTRID